MFGAGDTMMQIKCCTRILPGDPGSFKHSAWKWVVSIRAQHQSAGRQGNLVAMQIAGKDGLVLG